jgi:hypothetical protein
VRSSTTTSAPLPSVQARTSVESAPPAKHGSGVDGGDSGSHRDD